MDSTIHQIVFEGMPFNQFLAYFGWAALGAISFFLYSLYKAIKTDQNTPPHFEWKYIGKGAIRVILSVITLSLSIIFWDKISMFIFAVEEPIELNGWSSFLLGTLLDRIFEVILGGGDDAGKFVMKKLTK